MELDYNKDAVNLAKGYLEEKDRGGVSYLLVAHVSYDIDLEPDPKNIVINEKQYKKIQPKDHDQDFGYSF